MMTVTVNAAIVITIRFYIAMRTAAPTILITRIPIGIPDAHRRNRSAIPLSMLLTGKETETPKKSMHNL